MTKYVSPRRPGAALGYESDMRFVRDRGEFGAVVGPNEVLGRITRGAQSVAYGVDTFGFGGITGATAAPDAPVGRYTAHLHDILPSGTDHVVTLEDPTGKVIGTYILGNPAPGAFPVIPQGDFSGAPVVLSAHDVAAALVGNRFFIDVSYAAGSGLLVPYDPDATDGREKAVAVSIYGGGVNEEDTIIARGPAILVGEELVFSAAEDGERDAWLAKAAADLAELNLIVR